jgi:hypothetical protein
VQAAAVDGQQTLVKTSARLDVPVDKALGAAHHKVPNKSPKMTVTQRLQFVALLMKGACH